MARRRPRRDRGYWPPTRREANAGWLRVQGLGLNIFAACVTYFEVAFCWAFFCLRGKRDLFFFASLKILTDLGGVAGLSPTPTNAATLPTAAPTASAALTSAPPSFFFFFFSSAICPLCARRGKG
jgi:hypothetical protein